MIKHIPGEPRPWKVVSHKTGRKMASFDTEQAAKEHIARMKFFSKFRGPKKGT